MKDLVSIIMPAFNSEKYISESIETVISQTYSNWELIIVDDNSTDNTYCIIQDFISKNRRIKCLKLSENKGAAYARNIAIENAKGRFLAFLDADDLWTTDKLTFQIDYMKKNNCAMTFSNYSVITDKGIKLDKIIKVPSSLTYDEYLRNTIIQTLTVVIDLDIVENVKMPDIKMRQDFATWLSILKKGYKVDGIDRVLGSYRKTNNSLSSNKFKAAKKNWYVYRKIEKLGLLKSVNVFLGYAYHATIKRIDFSRFRLKER